ncbi:MAG: ABC transporter permease [Lachnospiraceae bacterium]|nr:ABC transporter permease [Lachnospiraceae bacterium]
MSINENNMERIPAEKFEFVQLNDKLHDKKLDTKPIGFFQDAMIRFSQNKGSVVCGIILLILILFAIFGPVISNYEVTEKDGYYSYALPKMSAKFDLGFWNGCTKKQYTQANYDYLCALGAIRKEYGTETAVIANREQLVYNVSVDSYARRGYVDILIEADELAKAQEYEKETGIRLFYPLIDSSKVACPAYNGDANAWFLTDQKGIAQRDENGNFIDIYLKDENSPYGDGYKYFSARQGAGQNAARVLYSDWYYYKNGKAPCFWFGADEFGYDIFTRLAAGARLSFLVSMSAAVVELIIGIIIGACEGYYGGTFDILMERFKEIFNTVPILVAITLFQIYFARKGGSLLVFWITLVLWGWIGTSSTVRAQFYRFKGMEYVMASRTLGAKDRRLIFRHILPNASGFIITSSVLLIPGIIGAESTYSFLGVINLNSRTMTSVGALLSNGQSTLTTYPHCVFFPAAFLGILLICFNIFGNGLRDAFNPTLRGAN